LKLSMIDLNYVGLTKVFNHIRAYIGHTIYTYSRDGVSGWRAWDAGGLGVL